MAEEKETVQSPMTLSQLANMKFDASKAASDQARSLSLAGLGIVWLFAGHFFEGQTHTSPAPVLFYGGAAFALALALDLIQLVSRTLLLEVNYQWKNWHSDPKDPDPPVPDTRGTNLTTMIFFYAKVLVLAAGYGCVVTYFAGRAL